MMKKICTLNLLLLFSFSFTATATATATATTPELVEVEFSCNSITESESFVVHQDSTLSVSVFNQATHSRLKYVIVNGATLARTEPITVQPGKSLSTTLQVKQGEYRIRGKFIHLQNHAHLCSNAAGSAILTTIY